MITTRDRLIASRALAAQRRWVAEAGESSEGWRKLPDYEAARFAADERAGEHDLSDDNGGEW